jgi:hypothetical protein
MVYPSGRQSCLSMRLCRGGGYLRVNLEWPCSRQVRKNTPRRTNTQRSASRWSLRLLPQRVPRKEPPLERANAPSLRPGTLAMAAGHSKIW